MKLSKKPTKPQTEQDEFNALPNHEDVYSRFENGKLTDIDTDIDTADPEKDYSNLTDWAKTKGLK